MVGKNVMITFGSGGHSTEMLMLLEDCDLNSKLESRVIDKLIFVHSRDDQLIQDKLRERFRVDQPKPNNECQEERNVETNLETVELRRARRVGQSYFTSIWTTLISLLQSVMVIISQEPKILLTNGPAVSVILSLAIRFLQLITFGSKYQCEILYVESFCRANTLSLSGRIIYHLGLADQFYVQWPKLSELYPKSKYIGLLV